MPTKEITWIPWNLSFRYIFCRGQFTPKIKANAERHLFSSLVWIDFGVVVWQYHLEYFFHEIKCNEMTSFTGFMFYFPCYMKFLLKLQNQLVSTSPSITKSKNSKLQLKVSRIIAVIKQTTPRIQPGNHPYFTSINFVRSHQK